MSEIIFRDVKGVYIRFSADGITHVAIEQTEGLTEITNVSAGQYPAQIDEQFNAGRTIGDMLAG